MQVKYLALYAKNKEEHYKISDDFVRDCGGHASATFYSLSSLMNMNRKLTNSRQQENQIVLISNIRMK